MKLNLPQTVDVYESNYGLGSNIPEVWKAERWLRELEDEPEMWPRYGIKNKADWRKYARRVLSKAKAKDRASGFDKKTAEEIIKDTPIGRFLTQ